MKTILLDEAWKETWVVGEEDEDANLKQFVDAFSGFFSRQVGEPVTVDFSFTHKDSYETEIGFEPFETDDHVGMNKWDVAYHKTCRAFETGDVWKKLCNPVSPNPHPL